MKRKEKTMKCHSISKFLSGSKPRGKRKSDFVTISIKNKKKKKEAAPLSKSRPGLKTIGCVEPPPVRPTSGTMFPRDQDGRKVQLNWFTKRTWMEHCPATCRIKCWVCRCYFTHLSFQKALAAKNQDVFASVGYEGNKHALDKFFDHENSETHLTCMIYHEQNVKNQQSIKNKLNNEIRLKQQTNRRCFLQVVRSTQFLCKQNVAFRGRNEERSNFNQMMNLCKAICPVQHSLPCECTSWKMQNELIEIMAENVKSRNLRKIKENVFFGFQQTKLRMLIMILF